MSDRLAIPASIFVNYELAVEFSASEEARFLVRHVVRGPVARLNPFPFCFEPFKNFLLE